MNFLIYAGISVTLNSLFSSLMHTVNQEGLMCVDLRGACLHVAYGSRLFRELFLVGALFGSCLL